jgi:hypothetical protein
VLCFAIGGGGTSLHWLLHHHCDDAVAVIALASLLLLQWHCCHRCTGAFAMIAPTLLPLFCWRYCCRCTGIVALVALALSHCCTSVVSHFAALALLLLL